MNADIGNHKADLDSVIVLGHELLKHCHGDEADNLLSKLDGK
jgi:hypothetical protein